MNITVRAEPFEDEYLDDSLASRPGFGGKSVRFGYRARPIDWRELFALAAEHDIEDVTGSWNDDDSASGRALRQAVAGRCIVAITSAVVDVDGVEEPLGVNGKPATDPSSLPLILGFISPLLAQRIGNEALARCLRLETELGESEPAPV